MAETTRLQAIRRLTRSGGENRTVWVAALDPGYSEEIEILPAPDTEDGTLSDVSLRGW
jgi:hypothetical protein